MVAPDCDGRINDHPVIFPRLAVPGQINGKKTIAQNLVAILDIIKAGVVIPGPSTFSIKVS